MAGILKLFCDGRGKQLYGALSSSSPFALPNLIQGSQTIEFTLMESDPVGLFEGAPWSTVSPQTFQLKIGLYLVTGATQLAYQNSWVDDTNTEKKTGVLGLNTAAIISALTTATSHACIFEISIIDATGAEEVVYQTTTTLKKAYGIASLTVPADETVATQNWTRATFVAIEEDDGRRLVLKAGNFGIEIGVNEDGSVSINGILL